MRILVTGSRTWYNVPVIQAALRKAWLDLGGESDTVLVSGHCLDGADAICEFLWWAGSLPVETHPAKWLEHGKRAGFIRNQEMVDLGADLCLAFHKGNSKGTAHTIAAATAAGIPVRVYRDESIAPVHDDWPPKVGL